MTETSARFIDIHLLHTLPYANINRDDLGSPKSVQFGGAERTRVSSQCWKRAVRLALERSLGQRAVRTRRLPLEIAVRLRDDSGWPEDLATFAGQQVVAAVTAEGLALESGGETSVLLYLPVGAVEDLTAVCVEHQAELRAALPASSGKAPKKAGTVLPRDAVNEVVAGRNAIINLFGRMLAELPTSNVDGAVQVAHAFTTHGTDPQVDFFTAVDDLLPAGETGSGHMNSAEYSAGTFYRYASLNIADLVRNLGGDRSLAADMAEAFLSAFITAMPEAKKNSTAPFTVPELAYVSVRRDRPVSLASAFEGPVRAPLDGGFSLTSRLKLDEYAGRVYQVFGTDGLLHHAHAAVEDKDLDSLGQRVGSYPDLVARAVGHTGLR
jgi:CRISPR system Cascade subunit CasC